MLRKLFGILLAFCFALLPIQAEGIEKEDTPEYKVSFYAFDCFNMMDESGRKYGYGYEMMQDISKYLQATFEYVGYDKSAKECEEMLRNGELDIYTAAKYTEDRAEEFAYSSHPAITAKTCMNVKVGNTKIKAGDYSTYNGLVIGLLARHTYNPTFLTWADEKGFSYEIRYYETQTDLSKALVNGEVDAVVNSYIGTPEDERTIEDFGDTPYYLMARKEDASLLDSIDQAIDRMNVETPNWRSDLYTKYYGTQNLNTEYTDEEKAYLETLKEKNTVIRAVMDADALPYSYFEQGEEKGITVELFKAAVEELGLEYSLEQVSSKEEYTEAVSNGNVDVWLNMNADSSRVGETFYKSTDSYLESNVSIVRMRGDTSPIRKLAVLEDGMDADPIIMKNWPDAEIVRAQDCAQCVREVTGGKVDGAILLSYTAQEMVKNSVTNRLRADIVPGASIELTMGINAEDSYLFYDVFCKALSNVAERMSVETVQKYVDKTTGTTALSYLFDHPELFVFVIVLVSSILFLVLLYVQSEKNKKKQEVISRQLSVALDEAHSASKMKNEFFSKMSHDIRTPLNVVLGMTQIARKYQEDPERLSDALDTISTEGEYLLVLINSILDVNQLEHGHVELAHAPFDPCTCLENCMAMVRSLAQKKEQTLILYREAQEHIVMGDENRYSQILMNILSNAVKYTDVQGRIEASVLYRDNGHCVFTCKDNGIGMSSDFLKHISEEYVRAEDSRVSKIQGTGLGMSVVKGFTGLMGGTLKVESAPGKGSVFIVDIPFEQADEKQVQEMEAKKVLHEEKVMYTGRKVLLAEDNSLNAEIAKELLESIGLCVDWAENGKIAVEKYEHSAIGEYAAIFMDMQMPVLDGVSAARKIRASTRKDADIPVFAMTANTFSADRKKCREAGMNGYISKPIDMEEIDQVLHTYLKENREEKV